MARQDDPFRSDRVFLRLIIGNSGESPNFGCHVAWHRSGTPAHTTRWQIPSCHKLKARLFQKSLRYQYV
jgi:hypothetical protein